VTVASRWIASWKPDQNPCPLVQLSEDLLDATSIESLAQFVQDHQGSFQMLAGQHNRSLLEVQLPKDRECLRLSIEMKQSLTERQRFLQGVLRITMYICIYCTNYIDICLMDWLYHS
jgi:hypothetical protein